MTITKSTIRQDAFARIYKILKDNLSSSITLTNAYPQNNNDFPIVIVNPIQISADVGTMGAIANSIRNFSFNITIEVYTRKAKDLDTISDTIANLFLTTETDSDLHNVTVEDGTADYTFVNNNTVRMKPIAVSFTMGK